jgi:hypothetical protein
MNIDFSAIDRAVEKVIAKHDAMFKLDMVMNKIKIEDHPFPANAALAAVACVSILSVFNARMKEINGENSKKSEIVTVY